MNQVIARHASWHRHRPGILARGLLPAIPANGRPMGVYVYRDDDEFDHPTVTRGGRVWWTGEPPNDVWAVAYVGPMMPDRYVVNGLVLLEPVPATDITLVTGHQ